MRNDLLLNSTCSEPVGWSMRTFFLAPLGVGRRCGIKKGTGNFHSIANPLIRQYAFLESKDDLRNMH